jgi:hypothetical protein
LTRRGFVGGPALTDDQRRAPRQRTQRSAPRSQPAARKRGREARGIEVRRDREHRIQRADAAAQGGDRIGERQRIGIGTLARAGQQRQTQRRLPIDPLVGRQQVDDHVAGGLGRHAVRAQVGGSGFVAHEHAPRAAQDAPFARTVRRDVHALRRTDVDQGPAREPRQPAGVSVADRHHDRVPRARRAQETHLPPQQPDEAGL